jgi:hypothetical protein
MKDANTLDTRLSAAFRGLDADPDFDARLVARLHAESQIDTAERARRARRLEQERYGDAKLELLSWRNRIRSISTFVTLESVGVAAITLGALAFAWQQESLRSLVPVLFTGIGVIAALVPLVAANLPRDRS